MRIILSPISAGTSASPAMRAVMPMCGRAVPRPMPHDIEVPTLEIAKFGLHESNVLVGIFGDDTVGGPAKTLH